MSLEQFVSTMAPLLDLESVVFMTVLSASVTSGATRTLDAALKKGSTILNLKCVDAQTGLMGKSLLEFQSTKGDVLPAHKWSPPLGQGVVYRLKYSSITVAFDDISEEGLNSPLRLEKVANELSKGVLRGPAADLVPVLFGERPPTVSKKDVTFSLFNTNLDHSQAYNHIVEQYHCWNRSSGRDPIWSFSWDEGACYAPKEIWNSMMLVHWGNTNSKHNHSTDNWDRIYSDRRGNHPCFDPDKGPDVNAMNSKLWARPREKRKTLFYFNGNLGPAYEKGRPEATYSMGIRQKVAEEFGSSPNKEGKLGIQHEGKLGTQHAEDVIVTPLRSDNYHEDLASSVFCGVMPGDRWSGRMGDSILQGCIPVVIQDGIYLPYEKVLNYESFAVRIREDEIPDLIKILRGFNETEIEFRLANVRKIWQRFLYRDSFFLEAERQKTTSRRVDDWATMFLQLVEDDVVATIIQVLHYKLHNDPWRRQLAHHTKEFGLPMTLGGNNLLIILRSSDYQDNA
ncbi:unnamed protein product [Camellia sinensis]